MSLSLSAIAPGSQPQFTSAVSLVEVYATVTAADGTLVTGLTRGAFTVKEDDVEQEISAFATGKVPLALSIGIDRSFSVSKASLHEVRGAVTRFLTALRPGDEAILLGIGSQPELLAPRGASRRELADALARLESWGTTPLHDAIVSAIDAMRETSGRRALILFSDGTDRYSTRSATEVQQYARAHDVILYPVAIGRQRPALFGELASVTGGRSFHANDARALDASLAAITRELRAQYLLGYVPRVAASDGAAWRSIRVDVNLPGARVRARDGYEARSAGTVQLPVRP